MQVQALNIINDTLTLKIDVCDTMFPDKMKWSRSQSVVGIGANKICIPKTETEKVEIVKFKNEFHKKSMPIVSSCKTVVNLVHKTNYFIILFLTILFIRCGNIDGNEDNTESSFTWR